MTEEEKFAQFIDRHLNARYRDGLFEGAIYMSLFIFFLIAVVWTVMK